VIGVLTKNPNVSPKIIINACVAMRKKLAKKISIESQRF
jgi:Fe2+ transport system protein FeoA